MFERYTERARRVLFFARFEAMQLNSRSIDTWHLLLAILAHGKSSATAFLTSAGMTYAGARAELETMGRGSEPSPPDTETALFIPTHPEKEPDSDRTTWLKIGPSRHGQRPAEHSHPQGWSLHGLTLRALLSRLHDIREDRIELPSSLTRDDRYDVSLWLPSGGADVRERLLREGVLQHFAIDVQLEDRTVDVYVLSAPDGPGKLPAPSPAFEDAGGGLSTVSVTSTSRDAEPGSTARAVLTGIGGSEFTMDDLAQTLEQQFQRPVVNETGLKGAYSLSIETEAGTTSEFLVTLKQKFGLALTPARRAITTLIVRTFRPPPPIR